MIDILPAIPLSTDSFGLIAQNADFVRLQVLDIIRECYSLHILVTIPVLIPKEKYLGSSVSSASPIDRAN